MAIISGGFVGVLIGQEVDAYVFNCNILNGIVHGNNPVELIMGDRYWQSYFGFFNSGGRDCGWR